MEALKGLIIYGGIIVAIIWGGLWGLNKLGKSGAAADKAAAKANAGPENHIGMNVHDDKGVYAEGTVINVSSRPLQVVKVRVKWKSHVDGAEGTRDIDLGSFEPGETKHVREFLYTCRPGPYGHYSAQWNKEILEYRFR